MEAGMIGKAPVDTDGRRHAYHLTDKGKALLPVLLALRDWGLTWIPDTAAKQS
jgi:DNA-binding HxlR family transcriptional regulator